MGMANSVVDGLTSLDYRLVDIFKTMPQPLWELGCISNYCYLVGGNNTFTGDHALFATSLVKGLE